MNQALKALGALLCYPSAELCAAADELRAALRTEPQLSRRRRADVEVLIAELEEGDLYDLQERYHLLFDRSRSLSLHLFEHVHGESRDRGQAMVDLLALYQRHQMTLTVKELPDYLPLFVEFVATRPSDEMGELLSRPLHIIAALGVRLARRDSAYAAVFQALEELAGEAAEQQQVEELAAIPEDDPADMRAVDALWEEQAVAFGGGSMAATGCGAGAGAGAGATPVSQVRVSVPVHSASKAPPPAASTGGGNPS